jgi:hypothetical protein
MVKVTTANVLITVTVLALKLVVLPLAMGVPPTSNPIAVLITMPIIAFNHSTSDVWKYVAYL